MVSLANYRTLYEFRFSRNIELSGKLRERPKSQIFALQSAGIRIFADFISLCIMLVSWINEREHNELYITFSMCYSLKAILCLKTLSRSASTKSITIANWFREDISGTSSSLSLELLSLVGLVIPWPAYP